MLPTPTPGASPNTWYTYHHTSHGDARLFCGQPYPRLWDWLQKTDAPAPFLDVEKTIGRNQFFPNNPLLSAIHIEGGPELTVYLVILINNELAKEPADIPSFDLVVDMEKWRNPKNRGPPRVQYSANQAETVRQIDLLLAQCIIERSPDSHYSLVLLTRKADGPWPAEM
jgi:hypothetical protein